ASCSDTLGFTAVKVPEGKKAFRGRDFFKLPRIELRCELGPGRFQVVDPLLDFTSPDLPLAIGSTSTKPSPLLSPQPSPPDNMEVDTRPSHHPLTMSSHHHHHHQQQQQQQHQQHNHHSHARHEQQQQQPPPLLPPIASASPPLPHPASQQQQQLVRSPPTPSSLVHSLPKNSPNNPPRQLPSPATKPVHDVQYAQPHPSSREVSVALANRPRETPPQQYPKPLKEVTLDALERIQTQVSQNSGALMVHNRDMRRFEETAARVEESLRMEIQAQLLHQSTEIRRVDDAVGRLQHEMRGVRDLLDALTHEVRATKEIHARSGGSNVAAAPSAQDSALEMMTRQIHTISQKASEVDTLRLTVEIMRNKIQRLEDAGATPTRPLAPREASVQPTHVVPPYHTTPPSVPQTTTPAHAVHHNTAFHPHGAHPAATTIESSQRPDPAPVAVPAPVTAPVPTQSGWVPVNSSVKRAHPNATDGPLDPHAQPLGSPKRPKLAPIEPRGAYANPHATPHSQQTAYQHMDNDDSEGRVQAHSRDSLTESTPGPGLSQPQPQPHSHYTPYATQDANSEDVWRSESQRTPRGRPRGSGVGNRGGRGRKSMPAHIQIGTPEWERDDWQGLTDSQTSPDGFYYQGGVRVPRGIIRRGSGGGGATSRGGRPSSSSGRSVSLGLQGVTAGMGPAVGMPVDPYAHTKKTRTKPIRNADGVLIRKDGRPDMRSQSSAANLRKVHAQTETPSPTRTMGSGNQDMTISVEKKHTAIMGKMFPGGVDESRKQHDLAHKVFEENQEHSAQSHSHNHYQHHHHDHNKPSTHGGARSLHIKRENADDARISDRHGARDEDVDMDRPEDHADDEGQTPSEQSDNSGQSHEDTEQEQAQQPKESVTPVDQLSTASTTQTIEATPAALA
ncbi:hypothetical protein B0J11DRAFT_435853, partial [Dendryphion nanum]